MIVRYLFQGKKLTAVLNTFWHSENYIFIVELETEIANQLEKRSSLGITNRIKENPKSSALFHFDFDNLDQYMPDIKGAGSIHTAHKIMLQKVESTNSAPVLEDMSPVYCSKGHFIYL